jgi:hypothetical protein
MLDKRTGFRRTAFDPRRLAHGRRRAAKGIKLSNHGKWLNDGGEFNEVPAIVRLTPEINSQ